MTYSVSHYEMIKLYLGNILQEIFSAKRCVEFWMCDV